MNFDRKGPPSYLSHERRDYVPSYRPSYQSKRGQENEWWKSKAALVGYLVAGIALVVGSEKLVEGVVASTNSNLQKADTGKMVERVADPLIIPRDELARDYNVFIDGGDRFDVELRQIVKTDPVMKELKIAKDNGQKRELYIVVIDDSTVSAKRLTDSQRQIPGLADYLTSKEFKSKKSPPSGNYATRTRDGVTRSYLTIAAKADKKYDYSEPNDSQNLPGPDSLKWRTGKPDSDIYPIVGNTIGARLNHEWSHANGEDHPGADLVGVVNSWTNAQRYFRQTGSNERYRFHIQTKDADIITKTTENNQDVF